MYVGLNQYVNIPDYVFVAIEAGALVRSLDGGRTWIDRVEQGPYDTHTLGTHQKAPKRLYSSAGDGLRSIQCHWTYIDDVIGSLNSW